MNIYVLTNSYGRIGRTRGITKVLASGDIEKQLMVFSRFLRFCCFKLTVVRSGRGDGVWETECTEDDWMAAEPSTESQV